LTQDSFDPDLCWIQITESETLDKWLLGEFELYFGT